MRQSKDFTNLLSLSKCCKSSTSSSVRVCSGLLSDSAIESYSSIEELSSTFLFDLVVAFLAGPLAYLFEGLLPGIMEWPESVDRLSVPLRCLLPKADP